MDSPLRGRLESGGEGKIICVWHPREGGAVKLHPAAGAFPRSLEKTEKQNRARKAGPPVDRHRGWDKNKKQTLAIIMD